MTTTTTDPRKSPGPVMTRTVAGGERWTTAEYLPPLYVSPDERMVKCERERCGRLFRAFRDRTVCSCGAFTRAWEPSPAGSLSPEDA